MTKQQEIANDYFKWLCDVVCENRLSDKISYEELLKHLHDTEFRYSMRLDENRANDGISLRYRYACEVNDPDLETYLEGRCSVLEMMVALCIRCEEDIMDDTAYGDRTKQWFWDMISNLGLGSMYNSEYNSTYVDKVLNRFLNREYKSDGRGGLFHIRDCNFDVREVEIWTQLMWHLNDIID